MYAKYLKRAFDVCGALVALAVLLPLMLVIMALVYLKLSRPVLFRQLRTGQHGQPFTVTKFRTMTRATDSAGTLLPDENRLQPFGRTLRTYGLDELPQLFDVLRGKMSLVGPRPFWVEHQKHVADAEAWRGLIRPGMTGLAQISGRSQLSWSERLQYDRAYAEAVSLTQDLRILAKTIPVILRREGVEPVHEQKVAGDAISPELHGLPESRRSLQGGSNRSLQAAEISSQPRSVVQTISSQLEDEQRLDAAG